MKVIQPFLDIHPLKKLRRVPERLLITLKEFVVTAAVQSKNKQKITLKTSLTGPSLVLGTTCKFSIIGDRITMPTHGRYIQTNPNEAYIKHGGYIVDIAIYDTTGLSVIETWTEIITVAPKPLIGPVVVGPDKFARIQPIPS